LDSASGILGPNILECIPGRIVGQCTDIGTEACNASAGMQQTAVLQWLKPLRSLVGIDQPPARNLHRLRFEDCFQQNQVMMRL
jgi:hypothetical protein